MIDERQVFERVMSGFVPPDDSLERLVHRRDRKRRNQRIAAGVVGIAVFVAAVWIVTSVGSLDRSEESVVPAGTGPVQTGPVETGPRETVPPALVEPAPIGTVTQSGAGCALEIVAEPIHPGAGRLSVVNETNRWAMFELYRFDPEVITFGDFEALVANGENGSYRRGEGYVVLARRELVPGASGTITDNFTTGDALAVVCLARNSPPQPPPPAGYFYTPFAVVGPIVVTGPTETGPAETAPPPVRASAAPDVRRKGTCSGDVGWSWELTDVGDEIRVRFDLIDFVGDIWRFVLRHGRAGPDFPPFDQGDGRVFFEGTRGDPCCEAGIAIQESVRDREGDDGFSAKAVDTRTGQVCKAQAVI